MAETPPNEEYHFKFVELPFSTRSLIYQRLLLGDEPTAGQLKLEMLHSGVYPDDFDACLADMTVRGGIRVDEYTTEVAFCHQAPFN